MFKEGKLDKILAFWRKLIPVSLFKLAQPFYHGGLAWAGAVFYGFPSSNMKVIGVTGTKGKSTTVYLISKIFEEALRPVQGGSAPIAAIGSLGFKIREKEWPNTLKMTMPGRFRLQKFLKQAKDAGVKYVILEVTSEGIKQKRHLGIKFDSAVLTGIHKEHIESHGSFEKYIEAKKKLFYKTKNIHILNADDKLAGEFKKIKSRKKIYYEMADWVKWGIGTELKGEFNRSNILAAATVAQTYGIEGEIIKKAIEKIKSIPGRMEFIDVGQLFKVVVDYAHTPDSLEQVYETLRQELPEGGKLICVLGAAGGGRDKWKRLEFGKIVDHFSDKIILTNEDPYDEDPEAIINDIAEGIKEKEYSKIINRDEAIKEAVTSAYKGDIVAITGKGSENSIATAGGKKIPWSDREVVISYLRK